MRAMLMISQCVDGGQLTVVVGFGFISEVELMAGQQHTAPTVRIVI